MRQERISFFFDSSDDEKAWRGSVAVWTEAVPSQCKCLTYNIVIRDVRTWLEEGTRLSRLDSRNDEGILFYWQGFTAVIQFWVCLPIAWSETDSYQHSFNPSYAMIVPWRESQPHFPFLLLQEGDLFLLYHLQWWRRWWLFSLLLVEEKALLCAKNYKTSLPWVEETWESVICNSPAVIEVIIKKKKGCDETWWSVLKMMAIKPTRLMNHDSAPQSKLCYITW